MTRTYLDNFDEFITAEKPGKPLHKARCNVTRRFVHGVTV